MVPDDLIQCIETEEPFRFVRVMPTLYTSEEPLGSATIERLTVQTGRNWALEVDYQDVLEYHYIESGYGYVLPERNYEEQIEDWKHGYMWGRFKLKVNCGTITQRTANIVDEYGHYFWVKYRAKLYELVPDPSKAVIELTLGETITGAIDRFKTQTDFAVDVLNKINYKLYGYKITEYSIDGSKLSLLVDKTNSPAIPVIIPVIVGAFLVIGIVVAAWKIVDYYQQKLIYEQEKTVKQPVWNRVYGDAIGRGLSPEEAVLLANAAVEQFGKSQDEILGYTKYIKYGVIALIVVFGIQLLSTALVSVKALAPTRSD